MLEYCWVPPPENACKVISADLHWNTENRRGREAINSFAARTLVRSSGKLGEYNILRSRNPPALCTFSLKPCGCNFYISSDSDRK